MKALIVSGGRIPSRELLDEVLAGGVDLIIGADAGAGVLFREGIAMDLALGDFDSIEPGLLEQIRSQTPVITYQVRKNFTDTEAALEEAIERGPRTSRSLEPPAIGWITLSATWACSRKPGLWEQSF